MSSQRKEEVARSSVVRELTEQEYHRWTELVCDSPHGSIYNTPEYLEVLCQATGGHYRVFGVFKGADLVGGVALYQEQQGGRTVISNRLLLYYNGIVLRKSLSQYPSLQTAHALETMTALEDALRTIRVDRLLLHNRSNLIDYRIFLERGWMLKPSYTYLVSLENFSGQLEKVEKNQRRLIRRAEEAGLEISDDDDFESFYQLHAETHQRKGAPLYLPQRVFKRYFQDLRKAKLCRIFHARQVDGQTVAAQLVLTGGHPVTHTVCAAGRGDSLHIGASSFLRWQVLLRLSQEGFRANDLTDAALNSVTHFKSQFGGELQMNHVLTRTDSWRYRCHCLAHKVLRRLHNRLVHNK